MSKMMNNGEHFIGYEPHHGRQANQKLKPYLVLQYLMRHTDENNVRCTNDIIAYL